MNNIKTIVEELKRFSEEIIEFNPPVDVSLVMDFELKHNIVLPKDYKELLVYTNGFSLMGAGVLGMDPRKNVYSLENVYEIEHNEVGNPQPKHLIPFSNYGRGNFYCFDTRKINSEGNSEIVFWQYDIDYSLNSPEVVNTDLADWVKEVIIDWTLEDYDYDGTER